MEHGKRAQKAADKEAAAILASLSKASHAAIETTRAGINKQLSGNIPLMYHIHALLNNDEWRGVLEASIHGHTDGKSGEKPEDEEDDRKLRQGLKKFAHLLRLDTRFHIGQVYNVTICVITISHLKLEHK